MLRWCLYSPRRLALVLLALLVVSALTVHVFGPPRRTHRAAAAPIVPSAAPTSVPSYLPPPIPLASPPASTAPSAAAAAVATRFMRAWVYHPYGTAAADWQAGVAPYVTIGYANELASTLPGRVPATAVTGPARVVASDPVGSTVTVPTDAGVIPVTLVLDADGWRVSSVEPPR